MDLVDKFPPNIVLNVGLHHLVLNSVGNQARHQAIADLGFDLLRAQLLALIWQIEGHLLLGLLGSARAANRLSAIEQVDLQGVFTVLAVLRFEKLPKLAFASVLYLVYAYKRVQLLVDLLHFLEIEALQSD